MAIILKKNRKLRHIDKDFGKFDSLNTFVGRVSYNDCEKQDVIP